MAVSSPIVFAHVRASFRNIGAVGRSARRGRPTGTTTLGFDGASAGPAASQTAMPTRGAMMNESPARFPNVTAMRLSRDLVAGQPVDRGDSGVIPDRWRNRAVLTQGRPEPDGVAIAGSVRPFVFAPRQILGLVTSAPAARHTSASRLESSTWSRRLRCERQARGTALSERLPRRSST
jgi:hypothetical protein